MIIARLNFKICSGILDMRQLPVLEKNWHCMIIIWRFTIGELLVP